MKKKNPKFLGGRGALIYVNVYEKWLSYGGPEEGGWWYSDHKIVESTPMLVGIRWVHKHEMGWDETIREYKLSPTQDRILEKIKGKYPENDTYTNSNYRGGDYLVCLENIKGHEVPRPHYE
jgi:hypothetical protein